MYLLDQISEEEYKLIERYIDDYAFDYDTRRVVPVKTLLTPWAEAKSDYLSKIFKDSLILKKDIKIEKEQEVLLHDMKDLLRENDFAYNYHRKICSKFEEKAFTSNRPYVYNYDSPDYILYHNICSLMQVQNLISNTWEETPFEIVFPFPYNDVKPIKVNKGTKITRVLQKLAKVFSLEESYEEFRIAHSQILNQKMLTGELCISIHPMDYMTMSDNDCGWGSCMSWIDSGEYRQGTVEMMNSPMVIVAYLTSKNNMAFANGCEWNSKKWRELYIITEDLITNVKSYPYENPTLTKHILSWLKELVEAEKISKYSDDCKEYKIRDAGSNMRISPTTCYMYNDFGTGNQNFAYFGENIYKNHENNYYTFNYSGLSECMACGAVNIDVPGEGFLVGDCCVNISKCEYCDEFIDDSELIEIDGMLFCRYCYEEHCLEDVFSEEQHFEENMTKLTILSEDETQIYTGFNYSTYTWGLDYKANLTPYLKNLYRFMGKYCTYACFKLSDLTDLGLEVLLNCSWNYHGIETKEELIDSLERGSKYNLLDIKKEENVCNKILSDYDNRFPWTLDKENVLIKYKYTD